MCEPNPIKKANSKDFNRLSCKVLSDGEATWSEAKTIA